MRETRQSGSEGGARFKPSSPTPIPAVVGRGSANRPGEHPPKTQPSRYPRLSGTLRPTGIGTGEGERWCEQSR